MGVLVTKWAYIWESLAINHKWQDKIDKKQNQEFQLEAEHFNLYSFDRQRE